MIIVKLPKHAIALLFPCEYEVVELEKSTGTGDLTSIKQTFPKRTWCEIHRLDKEGRREAIVARSSSNVSRKDSFSYEVGRKISLKRALKAYGLSKEDRTKVWHTYFLRPRPKTPPKAVKVQPVEEALSIIEKDSHAGGWKAPTSALSRAADAHLTLNAGEM